MSTSSVPAVVEPLWPRVLAAATYVVVVIMTGFAGFMVGVGGMYGLGRAVGSPFGGALPFGGLLGSLLAAWACRRAIRVLAAAAQRHLVRRGRVSVGHIADVQMAVRRRSRLEPDSMFVTVAFSSAPNDPHRSDRTDAALKRAYNLRYLTIDQALAFADGFQVGAPVQVHLGRRRLLYTTDLDATNRYWYQFW